MNKNLSSLWIKWFFTCFIITTTQPALADINLNGFATMAGGFTMSNDESLYAYDDDPVFDQNSLIGLQANSELGDGLTAVAQIVSRGRNDWEAEFEWAYVGYEFNDNVKLLAGKQRWPFYMYSDYLDVSYAYHWITPPEPVYNIPFSSATGVGALITGTLGDASSTLHLAAGRNREPLRNAGDETPTDTPNMLSLSWTLDFDWLSLRAGYSTSDLYIQLSDVEPLAGAWEQFSAAFSQPEWAEFANYIRADDGDESGSFGGLGFTVDYNDFLVIGEYTTLKTEGSFLQDDSESYYLSVGKRFGDLMPHITYGIEEITPSSTAFLDSVPSGLSPELDGLIAGTEQAFSAFAADNAYWIAGLRWDFHASAAFKAEYMSHKAEIPVNETNKLLRFAIVTVF